MKRYRVNKSSLSGSITLPPSKSQSIRALLFALLAQGKSRIENLLDSPDVTRTLEACQLLGAKINLPYIEGVGGKICLAEDVINVGNSGILFRFITAIAALSDHPIVITGDTSIRHQRPITDLLQALRMLGCRAESTRNDDYAPIIVRGPINAGKTALLGEDSQPVSALLMATPFASGTTQIYVQNPGETPWVDLTLHWLQRLNISYNCQDYRLYSIEGDAKINAFHYSVPGDLSSMAFPLIASLITQSPLTIRNVNMDDPQGDKKLISILQMMGAKITHQELELQIQPSQLRGIEIDINDCIDALPALAALACFAKGKTTIYNARVARQKECDRISCLAKELAKMGAKIEEKEDGLVIHQSSIKGAPVFSHQDHRLAMALSIAGLGAMGETIVHNIECISKTFPTFYSQFSALGAQIAEEV